jgi:hypothetical protein
MFLLLPGHIHRRGIRLICAHDGMDDFDSQNINNNIDSDRLAGNSTKGQGGCCDRPRNGLPNLDTYFTRQSLMVIQ